MMNKIWKWLLKRTSMEINFFQLVVWLPLCILSMAALLMNVQINMNFYQFMLFGLVMTYVFFMPLIFDCVKDYINSK